MKRNRLLVAATLLSLGLLGQAGVAAASDGTPQPAPTAGTDATGTPTPTPSDAPTGGGSAESQARDAAANTAPVAVDDAAVSVVAGKAVTLRVLVNDTDQETPGTLKVATADFLDGRVTVPSAATTITFASRAADAGRTFTVGYTATDGQLASNRATATVKVTAPPVVRTVSLSVPRTVVALRGYTLKGKVAPRKPAPARVTVQRLSGSTWKTYRVDRTISARGWYQVRFSTNRPTKQAFRAVATWRNGKRAVSPRVNRTVLARADAKVSGPLTRSAVRWSYRSGCPVGPSGLRRITINRFTYSHTVARGSLIVRAGAVPDLLRVFRASFSSRFPVRSMKPADAYYQGGKRTPTQSDVAAMKADNTSAFNCRPVTGNPYRVSQHSYGNAIDINTVRNPYVVGSRVYPSFARTYLDRGNVRTGMITSSGVIARTMRANGWPWGARWAHPDYQHFSANGG